MEDYMEQARELLRGQMAKSADTGVQVVNMLCDPPEEAVARVAAALEARDRRNAQ